METYINEPVSSRADASTGRQELQSPPWPPSFEKNMHIGLFFWFGEQIPMGR